MQQKEQIIVTPEQERIRKASQVFMTFLMSNPDLTLIDGMAILGLTTSQLINMYYEQANTYDELNSVDFGIREFIKSLSDTSTKQKLVRGTFIYDKDKNKKAVPQ